MLNVKCLLSSVNWERNIGTKHKERKMSLLYDDDETKSISDKNKIKRFYCPAHGDKSMNQNYISWWK